MRDSLWQRISAQIGLTDPGLPLATRICIAGTQLLGSDAVSIALRIDGEYEPIGSSGSLASTLDDLQFSLGDGPSFAAQGDGDPILVEDLFVHATVTRWPLFCDAARSHQVGAIFAFPLRIGAANLGVMTAYRGEPGPFTAEELSNGLVLASFAGAEIVRHLAGDPETLVERKEAITYDHAIVQFAAGMVSERLGISMLDALVRIRAHAFASGISVMEVSQRIASGRIVLDL